MLNAEQVLKEIFKADGQYIANFMQIAKDKIVLDDFLLGKVNAKIPYSDEEKEQIIEDLQKIVKQQFDHVTPTTQKTYTASAGAPGSGKTFFLEELFEIDVANRKFPENAIYVGPDSVALPQMAGYKADHSYDKWRDGSNFIANFMLVKAIADGVNIVHDTTATSAKMKAIFAMLHKEGYNTELHMLFANKKDRINAIIYRKNKSGDAQVTASDIVVKAEALYQRLLDGTYIGNVDKMTMYYQPTDYYIGEGMARKFAELNGRENPEVQIVNDGEEFRTHLLEQIDSQESLNDVLKNQVHEIMGSWKEKVAVSPKRKYSML